MNSRERHEARYQRRKAKRLAKRKQFLAAHTFESAVNRDALSWGADEAAKGVSFKESIKRFQQNKLVNIAKINRKLLLGQKITKGFICFILIERGKVRKIMSVHFAERVVQKSFNQKLLLPAVRRSIIYDNGSSLKDRGTSFAVKRLVCHLQRHFRRHGCEGYILLGDIHNYFGSMKHSECKAIIQNCFDDDRSVSLGYQFVDSFRDHYIRMAKRKRMEWTDENVNVGIGLGGEVCQSLAIGYLSAMDHEIKEVYHIHGYARFNDDFYCIDTSKEYLWEVLARIREICAERGLQLNEKKTQIVKLTHHFTYLKNNVYLTETGKVILEPVRDSITRERIRLKGQKRLFEKGVLEFRDIQCSYDSWKGSMKFRDSRRSVQRMDRLFNDLFINDWRENIYDTERSQGRN